MKINVTKEHIKKGQKLKRSIDRRFSCPIALAILDKSGIKRVEVMGTTVTIRRKYNTRKYLIPKIAQLFIDKVDDSDSTNFKPISFEIHPL